MAPKKSSSKGRKAAPNQAANYNGANLGFEATLADRFGKIAGPLLRAVKHFDEESRTLAAKRDALLPKLLSEEIRVKTPANAVEGVA